MASAAYTYPPDEAPVATETTNLLGYHFWFESTADIWTLQDLAAHHVQSCQSLDHALDTHQQKTFNQVLAGKRIDQHLLLFHANLDLLQRRIRHFAATGPAQVLQTCENQIRQFKRDTYVGVANHGRAEVVVPSLFDPGQRLRYSSEKGPYRWVRRSRSRDRFADLSWERVKKEA